MTELRLLALSGSLRAASINSSVLDAAALLAPAHLQIERYRGLGDLPLFNPDDTIDLPVSVRALREAIGRSDGLLIASPEYAHGISGVMKNALDWLVSGPEFVGKPVALINAAPRASIAQAALLEVVTTMSARVIAAASITLPIIGSDADTASLLRHPEAVTLLRSSLLEFEAAIRC